MAQQTELVEHESHGHEHPGELTYIKVAIFLAIITIAEVAIYYIQWMHDVGLIVPALLALSAVKFAAVVAFFMHLKFDDRFFTWLFGSGLAVAGSIILVLMALFHFHAIDYAVGLFE